MKHVSISNCYCVVCNNQFPIPRIKRQRELGHIKNLYCPVCRKVTGHIEVREKDFILSWVKSSNDFGPKSA